MLSLMVGLAQAAVTPWDAWVTLDLTRLDDDGTGATFALADVDGVPTLAITPGGRSDETKLAYPVSGADLQIWREYDRIQLDVYLPGSTATRANGFFLGLAEVTRGWRWIGGVFGQPEGATGWIRVRFALDPALRDADPDGRYILYLSFFHQAGGAKIPLTEPFYVGALTLSADGSAAASADDARYQREAADLLTLDDAALLEAVARRTFAFFWLEAHPQTGLIKDRSTPDSVSSIAATGFGLAAIPLAVERGWIAADAGYERVRLTLHTFLSGGVQGQAGFFYHFVNPATGERAWNSELSSIDTALLAAGALVAGAYFDGTEVAALAASLYTEIDWDWMRAGGELVRMGWLPESGFLDAAWDHFDESLLLYALAIGSPTHPVPAYTWDLWERPVRFGADPYIYLRGEPLFVYQYPLIYLDLRNREDAYANYWNNAAR
ncbi:MAG: hypothetical protein NZM00_05250, partial [Anaerolinea sp.]|nr:hypothetical protein [Anaerolinea sp.]